MGAFSREELGSEWRGDETESRAEQCPVSDIPADCLPVNYKGLFVILSLNKSFIWQIVTEFYTRYQVLGIQRLTVRIESLPFWSSRSRGRDRQYRNKQIKVLRGKTGVTKGSTNVINLRKKLRRLVRIHLLRIYA